MRGTISPPGRRALVVEEDPSLSASLCYSLEAVGYQVRAARSGQEACDLVGKYRPDLVLLEIALPDVSGLEVCRQIRARSDACHAAIVFVTENTQEADRVAAFEAGADDFVAKPYSTNELMLRLQARLPARRPSPAESASPMVPPRNPSDRRIALGPLDIDQASHRVFLGGHELNLSVLEMRLLNYLASEPGKMRSRRDLLTAVWGYHPDATSRTLDTHIKRLRDKFGELAAMIQTIHGVGYRIALPAGRTGGSDARPRGPRRR